MKNIGIISILFLLSACADLNSVFSVGETTPLNVTQQTYPNLPDVSLPNEPVIIPWVWDIPRDNTKTVVKNVRECVSVAEASRNADFWVRCGEHPYIPSSNIFRGVDLENYNLLNQNIERMNEYSFQLKQRVDEINKQRQEWRRINEEIKNKPQN